MVRRPSFEQLRAWDQLKRSLLALMETLICLTKGYWVLTSIEYKKPETTMGHPNQSAPLGVSNHNWAPWAPWAPRSRNRNGAAGGSIWSFDRIRSWSSDLGLLFVLRWTTHIVVSVLVCDSLCWSECRIKANPNWKSPIQSSKQITPHDPNPLGKPAHSSHSSAEIPTSHTSVSTRSRSQELRHSTLCLHELVHLHLIYPPAFPARRKKTLGGAQTSTRFAVPHRQQSPHTSQADFDTPCLAAGF